MRARDLIFVPREGEELPSAEEKGNKIILKTKQLTTDVHEITSPTAKGLAEYDPILDGALSTRSGGDRVLQAVDWLKKRSCAIMVTENIDHLLAGVPGGTSTLTAAKVGGQPYLLTSEYVTDRFEFEGLADLVGGCVKDDDLLYLCFDWEEKKNLMLFSTRDPGDRQKCLMAQDIYLEPE